MRAASAAIGERHGGGDAARQRDARALADGDHGIHAAEGYPLSGRRARVAARTQSRPASFAAYSARSAAPISESAVSPA